MHLTGKPEQVFQMNMSPSSALIGLVFLAGQIAPALAAERPARQTFLENAAIMMAVKANCPALTLDHGLFARDAEEAKADDLLRQWDNEDAGELSEKAEPWFQSLFEYPPDYGCAIGMTLFGPNGSARAGYFTLGT